MIQQMVASIVLFSFGGKVIEYLDSLNYTLVATQMDAIVWLLLGLTIYYAVFGTLYYVCTNLILRKKLNLE